MAPLCDRKASMKRHNGFSHKVPEIAHCAISGTLFTTSGNEVAPYCERVAGHTRELQLLCICLTAVPYHRGSTAACITLLQLTCTHKNDVVFYWNRNGTVGNQRHKIMSCRDVVLPCNTDRTANETGTKTTTHTRAAGFRRFSPVIRHLFVVSPRFCVCACAVVCACVRVLSVRFV